MCDSGGDGPGHGGKYTQAVPSLQSSLRRSFSVISKEVLKIVFHNLSRVYFKFFLRIILFELYSHTLLHLRITIVYSHSPKV